MDKTYVIRFIEKRGTLFLKNEEPYNMEDLFYGRTLYSKPLKMVIVKGTRNFDFAYFPDVYNIAHSEAVIEFIEGSNFTGFRTFPLEIRDCSWKYFGVQYLGRCGEIIRPKATGYVHGMNFDKNLWDGSDLFVATNMGSKFCTENFRERALKSRFFTKENFEPMDDFKWYNAGE
jgi:hypothetical protein